MATAAYTALLVVFVVAAPKSPAVYYFTGFSSGNSTRGRVVQVPENNGAFEQWWESSN